MTTPGAGERMAAPGGRRASLARGAPLHTELRPGPVVLALALALALAVGGLPLALGVSQLCFAKVSDTAAIYMLEHPLRGRAAVALQSGKILLMSLPAQGGARPMATMSTYLDLSARVLNRGEMGLHSFAFHPNFAKNGRFFVTYTCDSTKTPDCVAPFGCKPSLGCTPRDVQDPRGQYTTIVAEYSAGPNALTATSLKPTEVRRILAFARPHNNHHGGHIFFDKAGLLYLTSGDGGSQNDPWKLAQNPKSFFGKVLRLNVNRFTASTNYTVPRTNPFRGASQNQLVYALGLRNPWRCDQDPASGTIACGDVGGSRVEEVNVVVPGGNYEWVNYEGSLYQMDQKNVAKLLGKARGPLFSYTHDSLGGVGCIIGGVFYTSPLNQCLVGKYLYADHSGPLWVATIGGPSQSTQRVSFTCATPSPVPCPAGGDGSDTEWGEINSWSRDRSGNAYLLTSTGVYRMAKLSTCGISC